MSKVCKICYNEFEPNGPRQKYCSPGCSDIAAFIKQIVREKRRDLRQLERAVNKRLG